MSKVLTADGRAETETDTDPTSSPDLGRTDVHDVLSNERRLILLDHLATESPRELGPLAEDIAAVETGQRPPPRNKRQSVYVTLHQTHLPKLDALDIVDYDARAKVVDLSDRASVVIDFDTDAEAEPVGAGVEPYLGVVLGGLGASFASTAGVPPFSTFSVGTYAVGTLVALLVGFAYRIGRDGSEVAARLRAKYR